MNPREIAPLNTSLVNSTRFPCPYGNGGGQSSIRGSMPRPRRTSLPPILPYPQTPVTGIPMGPPNFSPGPRLPMPMYQPSPPPVFFGSVRPMSQAPSWSPCYPPAPVANYNAALPPRQFTRPTTLPTRKANRRGNSLSLMPKSAKPMIYPKPGKMPVGVKPKEGPGEKEPSHEKVTNVTDVSLTDYMDPDKIFDVYNEDDWVINIGESKNGKSSGSDENGRGNTSGVKSVSMESFLSGNESLKLPPATWNHQGVTNSVDGNKNAFKIDKVVLPVSRRNKPKYSALGIREISLSDPKEAKRILANRVSSARANEKRARYVKDMEEKVRALKREGDVLTANFELKERSLSVMEEENKQLRIHANGLQEKLVHSNALIDVTGEDPRLNLATDEVIPNRDEDNMSNMEPLDTDMFLNLSQLDQTDDLGFNEQII